MTGMASAGTTEAAAPAAAAPLHPPLHLSELPSLDFSSRADSGNSLLSGGSGSASSDAQQQQQQQAQHMPDEARRSGSGELAAAVGGSAASGPPIKKVDARSSALKALAGVSAIVSKSRKVDAEALQAIKSQRAKARAEGHAPSGLASASSVPAAGGGRVTSPPGGPGDGPTPSPFASATSQGLVRSPSGNNLALAGLTQATSLPLSMHSQRVRRSPATTPPTGAAGPPSAAHATGDYEGLVGKMTITELVALKQAVEGQLAKQAMALAQLHATSSAHASPHTDMLSQQYAALLLQNAQQAQLVQQLSSQQQAAHAVAIQQALSAAAAAAGITSPTFSPDQLLLEQQGSGPSAVQVVGGAPMSQYASMPLPDPSMASPFAAAAFGPPEAGFDGLGGAQRSGGSAGLPAGGSTKGSGSPRSASAEQHLIGEALHSFVDPERQGPPSRQGSALVNGINWSDRRASGALPPASAFARSRSLPHPQDGLAPYGGDQCYLPGEASDHLPSLFNSLSMVQEGGAVGVGMPVLLPRGGPPLPPPQGAHMSPNAHSVSFADSVHTHSYQHGY